MRIALSLVLSAVFGFAEDAKPTCDKTTRGQFWPAVANHDRQQLFELARKGELEICASHDRKQKKFQWEFIGVHVSQLPKSEPDVETAPPNDPGTRGPLVQGSAHTSLP